MRFVIAFGLATALSGALVAAAPGGAQATRAGGDQSRSAVADAAMRRDQAGVRALLQQGADVNAAQGDGMSALHWAAERGDAELAGMLLYAGANPAAVTRIGAYTPLHLAARAASVPVVQALIKAGADVNAKTSSTGVTPLHLAASSGNPDVIAALIDKGADVNARESEWGQTPLIFAASENRARAIKVLMARGADAEVTTKVIDIRQFSALDRAANERQRKVLESFVPNGQKPTASQVQAAVQAARDLFASGKVPPRDPNDNDNPRGFNPEEINPPVATKGGLTALMHAARQGYTESVVALLDGGAKIDTVGAGDASSPLLVAVVNGQFDTAMVLVDRGADPNLASSDTGTTPLWAAINVMWQPRTRFPQPQEMELQKTSYLDMMEALLEKGADPNARMKAHPWYLVYSGCGNRNCGLADTSGSTAFWRAAYATDVEAMKLLVKYGADANIPTIAPRVPVRRGPDGAGGPPTNPVAANLDQSGLPQVPYGGPGSYPLHAAAGVEYGEGFAGNAHRHAPGAWLASVKYLVEELGVDVNARDNDGYNALHHAAARGDNEVIMYLVSKGADVTAISRRGQTTADMANGPVQRVSPFPETVKLLEKLGSKNNHNCVSC